MLRTYWYSVIMCRNLVHCCVTLNLVDHHKKCKMKEKEQNSSLLQGRTLLINNYITISTYSMRYIIMHAQLYRLILCINYNFFNVYECLSWVWMWDHSIFISNQLITHNQKNSFMSHQEKSILNYGMQSYINRGCANTRN